MTRSYGKLFFKKINISLKGKNFLFQEIKSLQGNRLEIKDFWFFFGKAENKIKKTYLTDKEKEGIRKALELLVERINFYKKEYVTATDASIRFTLKKQIEDLEKEITDYRNKLKE